MSTIEKVCFKVVRQEALIKWANQSLVYDAFVSLVPIILRKRILWKRGNASLVMTWRRMRVMMTMVGKWEDGMTIYSTLHSVIILVSTGSSHGATMIVANIAFNDCIFSQDVPKEMGQSMNGFPPSMWACMWSRFQALFY